MSISMLPIAVSLAVAVVFHQIYNWTPRVFNETDENQLTDEYEKSQYRKMPDFLKEAIAQTRNPAEVRTHHLPFFFSLFHQ